MKTVKKIVDTLVAKAAYEAACKNVNQACFYFFYQQKLPEKVKKLRKF